MRSRSGPKLRPRSFIGRSLLLNTLMMMEAGAGFAIDISFAAFLGLSSQSDALYAAWMLPQAIGRGVFQSLTNSLIGLFSDVEDRDTLYRQAMTVVAVVSMFLSLVLLLTSSLWLPLTVPGAPPETRKLALSLFQVLVWLIIFFALAETCRAVYYREERPEIPALARIVGSAITIGIVWGSASMGNTVATSWALFGGSVVEATFNLIGLRWFMKIRYRPMWPDPRTLRALSKVVGMPLLGQSIRMLAATAERALASLLPPGSVTAVNYANRIVSSLERFVFRGFLVATIQDYATRGSFDLRRPLRFLIFISTPLAITLAVFSKPIVAIVFERGQFTESDAVLLATTLGVYAPAIFGIALTRLPFGIAYAKKRGPLILGYFTMVSGLLLLGEVIFIYLGLGLRAFGVAYSVAINVTFVWLSYTILRSENFEVMTKRETLKFGVLAFLTWVSAGVTSVLFQTVVGDGVLFNWGLLIVGLSVELLVLVIGAFVLRLTRQRDLLEIASLVFGRH